MTDVVLEPEGPTLGAATVETRRPGRRRRLLKNAAWYLVLTALSLVVLFPVWMILMRALSQPISYLSAGQPPRPVDPEWDVFQRAFNQGAQ